MKVDHIKVEFKFAKEAPDGTFSGYGAVFGNEDFKGDVIAKGAFRDTLKEWKKKNSMPKMLLQHGGFLGDDQLPIGVWQKMEEDDNGLVCEGQLFALATQKGQYIYEGLKSGALDGLSIGFRAKDFSLGTKPNEPYRTLKTVDLLEVSVVTFPANEKALVSDVKGLDELKSLADCEKFAREAFGLSRKAALNYVSAVKKIAQRDAEKEQSKADLLSAVRQVSKALKT